MITASGLFDPNLYIVEGPDVREARQDPLTHYCLYGWREGRRPNLYFDPLWYRELYLAGSDENPLVHYIRCGEAAGYRPVSYFDPAWYAQKHRVPSGTSPLGHYLANRRSQSVAPNPEFDLHFYLRRHGDVLGPNRDAFAHFLLNGTIRDIDPSIAFDSAAYRSEMMQDEEPPPIGPRAWAAADRRVPLVHWLDTLVRAAHECQS